MASDVSWNILNGDIEFIMTFTAASAKAQATVNDAALFLYPGAVYDDYDPENPTAPDSLSNNQKAQIVWRATKQYMVQAAKQYHIQTEIETARTNAGSEAETNYGFTDT